MRTAMGVMGALFAIFFGIIVIAGIIGSGGDGDPKLAQKLVDERTAPFATVATDASQIIKPASSEKKHEPLSGEQVVAQVCSACHAAGMLGAPKIGDKAEWSKRKAAAGGLDGLVKIAISGIRQMPPRGGNPDLSDDEIKAAISEMLSKSGA